MGTVLVVLMETRTRFTLGHCFTAWSTVFFSSIILPPLSPWFTVITVSDWAAEDRRAT